jgi:hypothetical protein
MKENLNRKETPRRELAAPRLSFADFAALLCDLCGKKLFTGILVPIFISRQQLRFIRDWLRLQ